MPCARTLTDQRVCHKSSFGAFGVFYADIAAQVSLPTAHPLFIFYSLFSYCPFCGGVLRAQHMEPPQLPLLVPATIRSPANLCQCSQYMRFSFVLSARKGFAGVGPRRTNQIPWCLQRQRLQQNLLERAPRPHWPPRLCQWELSPHRPRLRRLPLPSTAKR